MTNQTPIAINDVEQALQALETVLPMMLSIVGAFYPAANAVKPFLPLLQVALQGVQVVQQATNSTPAEATQAVINTLTPGQSSAPALQ